MDLWIRSQDRETLLKTEIVMIEEQNENEFWIYLGHENYDPYRVLGVYKTKERALNVLDDIQDELISSSYFPGNPKEEFLVCGSARVYEMPEE